MKRPKRLEKSCLNCGAKFLIPPCREWREKCCSSVCKKEHRTKQTEAARLSRRRECEECGADFYPRQYQIDTGQGRFCSHPCSIKNTIRAAHTEQANKRRAKAYRDGLADGSITRASGEDHPSWMGGMKATLKRRQEDGRAAATLRKYRRANPHKVREFARSRARRKFGRLPKGTVKRIHQKQRGKCAICHVVVGEDYHMDHIYPLAKGGEHAPENIQILCPTCNVRKSAKDPIDYMQELGRLL